jgi:ADP-ribose pyrophosphatase
MSRLRSMLDYPTGITQEIGGVRFTPTQDPARIFIGTNLDDEAERNDPANWKEPYVGVRGGFRFEVKTPEGGWTAPAFNTVTSCSSGVAVILYDPKADIVGITEEFRLSTYMRRIAEPREDDPARPPGWVFALPMGATDPGETSEQAAAREAFEETGCRVGRLWKGPEIFQHQPTCADLLRLFVAEFDSTAVQTDATTGIDQEAGLIRFHLLTPDALLQKAMAGEFDTIGMAGILFFQSVREEIRCGKK